ncbi:hypothetical protein AVEN_143610-1 [Araneus ventricosus]|uniref:Uncharacterized protein n=1 Tax=Araneus ventricosus TaxID=182803 RepID=A0A4Y2AN15_ARAVE|nr:hypothetical protein AVEN_143610-1 [Araneus ventricosus]
MTVHQTLMDVQTVSSLLHQRRKREKNKVRRRRKMQVKMITMNSWITHVTQTFFARNVQKTITKIRGSVLRCIMCQIWLHEDCTTVDDRYNDPLRPTAKGLYNEWSL